MASWTQALASQPEGGKENSTREKALCPLSQTPGGRLRGDKSVSLEREAQPVLCFGGHTDRALTGRLEKGDSLNVKCLWFISCGTGADLQNCLIKNCCGLGPGLPADRVSSFG